MKRGIGFNNIALLQNLEGKRGKRKEKQRKGQEYTIQIKQKYIHQRNSEEALKLLDN